MKKKESKKEIKKEWQTGDYDRHAEFKFMLSAQFLMLCKLMGTTPYQVLLDFMDQLSQESWTRKSNDPARQKLVEYFLLMGYGQDRRSPANISAIFKELEMISETLERGRRSIEFPVMRAPASVQKIYIYS